LINFLQFDFSVQFEFQKGLIYSSPRAVGIKGQAAALLLGLKGKLGFEARFFSTTLGEWHFTMLEYLTRLQNYFVLKNELSFDARPRTDRRVACQLA